jgi:subtilisin
MKKFILSIPIVFIILAATTSSLINSNHLTVQAKQDANSTGSYIVVLKDDVDSIPVSSEISTRFRLNRKHNFNRAIKGFSARLDSVQISNLRTDSRVKYIVEDRIVKVTGKRISRPSQVTPSFIKRIEAENKVNKGSGIDIAVIDTGIDLKHPDLRTNIAGGVNCSDESGYGDGHGHGTHVAGIIAAKNNLFGTVGVAPDAKLWSIRVLNSNGTGTWSSVICGIDFITANAPKNGGKIKVANMSLTGYGFSDNNCGLTNNDPLHLAICRSRDAGVTYVVAAGNSGEDVKNYVPAAYDDAVITVSALNDTDGKPYSFGQANGYGEDDTFASFSNYGESVDIAAPGTDIYSTYLGGGYGYMSGTSMASPVVAGAVALYKKSHPLAPWTQVIDELRFMGERLNGGHADYTGRHPEPVVNVKPL